MSLLLSVTVKKELVQRTEFGIASVLPLHLLVYSKRMEMYIELRTNED